LYTVFSKNIKKNLRVSKNAARGSRARFDPVFLHFLLGMVACKLQIESENA